MVLRNAFDNLGTESALRRIANLLTFARDPADRIRVVVDTNNATNVVNMRNSSTSLNGNDSPSWFAAPAWNVMDARETMRVSMRANSDAVKRSRWTY